jgi:uncharacterized membrane protein (UPF0136 family)
MEHKKRWNHLLLGIFLMLVGGFLLVSQLYHLPLHPALFSWKSFLIGLGVVLILTEKNPTSGIIVAAIGTYFLLPDLVATHLNQGRIFWPFILIVIGLVTIFSKKDKL